MSLDFGPSPIQQINLNNDTYIFECPHCKDYVTVLKTDINCRIFRHAIFKNGSTFNPHASKIECEQSLQNGLIWGCGKPFIFDGTTVQICGYI